MTKPQSQSFRSPTADVWRRTLSQIPTVFGRLVYVTSLRDPATGQYRHDVLSNLLGPEDSHLALSRSHSELFSQWLAFNLAEQKSDLDDYLRTAGGLKQLRDYSDLIPPTARDVERQLYLTDLETLMELLRCEPGGGV